MLCAGFFSAKAYGIADYVGNIRSLRTSCPLTQQVGPQMLLLLLPQQKKRTRRMMIIQQQLPPPNPQLQFIIKRSFIKIMYREISLGGYIGEPFGISPKYCPGVLPWLFAALIVHIMRGAENGEKIF